MSDGYLYIGAERVKPHSHFYGVKYWAWWYSNIVPRYEIYVAVGLVEGGKDAPLYCFKSYKRDSYFFLTQRQLFSTYFRPFVLDKRLIIAQGYK